MLMEEKQLSKDSFHNLVTWKYLIMGTNWSSALVNDSLTVIEAVVTNPLKWCLISEKDQIAMHIHFHTIYSLM